LYIQAEHSKNAVIARIATKVVNVADEAFGSGLHWALEVSGALLLLGAEAATLTIHRTGGQTYDLGRRPRRADSSPRPQG
jgi:hypothetical protein